MDIKSVRHSWSGIISTSKISPAFFIRSMKGWPRVAGVRRPPSSRRTSFSSLRSTIAASARLQVFGVSTAFSRRKTGTHVGAWIRERLFRNVDIPYSCESVQTTVPSQLRESTPWIGLILVGSSNGMTLEIFVSHCFLTGPLTRRVDKLLRQL